MENTNTFVDKTMNLIAENHIKEALIKTQELLKGSPLFNEVIVHSARYSDVMKAIRLGTISLDDANIEKNRVRFGLMDILQELSINIETNPALKTEVETYFKEKKPSTSNHTHVEGDNNMVIQGITGSQINISAGKLTKQKADKIYNIEKIDKADFS